MADYIPASHLLPALAGKAWPCPTPPFTESLGNQGLKVAWGRQWAGSLCSAHTPRPQRISEPQSQSGKYWRRKRSPGWVWKRAVLPS